MYLATFASGALPFLKPGISKFALILF